MVSNHTHLVLAAAALAVGIGSASAQDVPATSQDPALAADKHVVIAVRAPDKISSKELEDRFKLALESAGTKVERVQAKPMELATFDRIKEFLTTVQIGPDMGRLGTIARRSTRSSYWDIYLPDGYNQIDKLQLEYREKDKGNDTKTAEFKPVSRSEGEKDAMARLVYLGLAPPQLELRADPSWQLIRYTVHLKAWGDKPAKALTEQFEAERCYRLEISGYRGTLRELFETLGDQDRIGVAMVGIQPPKTLALGLADLVGVVVNQDGDWYQNIFRVRVTPPAKPRVDRAWVLFPLSKDKAEELKASLEADIKSGGQTSVSLSESLAKGSLAGYTVSDDLGNVVLRAKDPPRWHMLSDPNLDKGSEVPEFTRQFVVDNTNEWKGDPRKDGAWRVLMFEFDVRGKDKNRTGSKVILPTKLIGDMGENSRETHFHVHQVQSWATGESPLKQAVVPPVTTIRQ